MIEGTPPIDRHAAAAAVERNFVETWQLIAAAYPDGEIHDADGLTWHAFTGPNDDPRSTSVLRINLADGEADAVIDELLAALRGRGQGSVWWTWRRTRPANAGQRLRARGLEQWPAWPGMAINLEALPPPPVHNDFAIRAVRSQADFEGVLAVLEPLGMRGIFAGAFERIGAREGWGASVPVQHFVGRMAEDLPVACATLCTAGDAAGIYAVAVAEDARRRGYGRAISLAALQAGADAGHRFGVLQSSTMGFGVYRAIGLTLVCRLQAYEDIVGLTRGTGAARYHRPPGRRNAMRTLIKGGTIVNADATARADVLIDGETIAMIGTHLEATADRTVDASGKWVIPGGIDVHTHMELPFGGTAAKDTFETGTRAAAFGGTTTIIDFAVQPRGGSLRQGLDSWHEKAEGEACIDYGFHMIISDVRDDVLAEMDTLVDEGVTTFKLFTAYPGVFFSDDGAIFQAMQQTKKNGGLIMMHAENGLAIDVVAGQHFAVGNIDPYFHGTSRSPVLEGEATNRVIRLAQVAEAPVYIVHLAAREALNEVRRARDEGLPAFAETCPQYLFLSLEDLGNGFEGSKFVCSPPLRPADHQEDLWIGLLKDDLQVVSTDHCPFDFHGQKEMGRGDFRKVPNGLPGVENRMDLMHSGGVAEGRLTPNRWVEITSAAPARMFGLPQKGAVQVGLDADVVVYDPNRRHTISASTHHMDVDYSCYEGWQVTGGSDVVLSRGRIVVDGDEWLGETGGGRFLKRERSAFLK